MYFLAFTGKLYDLLFHRGKRVLVQSSYIRKVVDMNTPLVFVPLVFGTNE